MNPFFNGEPIDSYNRWMRTIQIFPLFKDEGKGSGVSIPIKGLVHKANDNVIAALVGRGERKKRDWSAVR